MSPARGPQGDDDAAWDHLQNAPNPMSRVAPDGTILWANAAELAFLGLEAGDYIGRNIAEFHVDAPSAPALLEAIRSGKGTRDQPVRLRTRSGEIRHVLVDVNVRSADGKPAYGRATMRDITDRARVAHERQAILEAALASTTPLSRTTDGYLHLDRDWRITFAQLNAGPERSAAIVGKRLWDVYPDVSGSEFETHYRAAMADRKPRTFRAYYAPQDLWLENRLFPAGDGLALYYRDINWQQALERQLADRNRQQAAAAELGRAALRGRPIAELLQDAVRTVATTLGVDVTKVLEVRDGGASFCLVAGVGLDPLVRQVLPAAVVAQASFTLEQNQPVLVPDLAQEARFVAPPLLVERGVVSGVSVPLPGPHGSYGVLGAHSKAPRLFTQDDVHFLQNVANLLANALQRQQVDLQHATVARLGAVALRSASLDELVGEATQAVAAVLRADLVGVVQADGDQLRVGPRGVGLPPGLAGTLLPADPGGQVAYVLRQGRAVVVADLPRETRFRPAPPLLEIGVASGVCAPLQGPDGAHGILGVHTLRRRAFTDDDVHFVESVANLLSSALQRARSDEQLRAQRDVLEDTVAERTALLERSNREMEAFNYTVSHDLRSPLRNIGGFAGLLAHRYGPQLPPEAKQILGRIQQGVGRMGDLIDVLLNLARLHRVELQRTDVDITALAQAIGGELAANGGRDVDLHVAPGLRAQADPGLTRVLLENLLTNAWKFTRRASGARVEVVPAQVVDGPGFVVRDNGAGFDPEHAGRLFEPFHRLHNVTEYEGTGIGLATVRRIAERHGGRVWAHGQPGEGAAFGFTLPPPPQPRLHRPQ